MIPGAAEGCRLAWRWAGQVSSESAEAVKSVVPCGESHIGLGLVPGEGILCRSGHRVDL